MRTRPHNVIARLSDQELQDLYDNCRFFLKSFPANKSDRLRFLFNYLTRKRHDLAFQSHVEALASDETRALE